MEPAIIGAAAGVVSAGIAAAGFWLALGGRIGKAEASGETAVQVAAEVEADLKSFADKLGKLEKEMIEIADRVRREFGETVTAMQQKIHEFETWARDEFVRKQSFEAMMARTEKAQELRDERLDKRLERIENKIDEASAFRNQ